MKTKDIFQGSNKFIQSERLVSGEFVELEGEKFYKIGHYNKMADFFMTIVSNSDHWMFLSSNGSLSAGRKNRDNALFPYYTVDKIHDYKNLTGSRTWCLVEKENKTFLWEPFTDESGRAYNIQRNLYKSIYGNKIVFEELNEDLEACFQYGWYNSEKFGWIKKSSVSNLGNSTTRFEILDGIRNILPYGADYFFQTEYSNLLDAYKKNELLPESKLGLFMLSSIPVDKAEPSEALKTTTVWSCGIEPHAQILISDHQVERFIKGLPVETESDVRASRGAYYIKTVCELRKEENQEWYIVAEINQDSSDVANLDTFLQTEKDIVGKIIDDIVSGTSELERIVASADGLQMGNEELDYARHFSNTMFNIMRGGVFADNYQVDVRDLVLHVQQTNKSIERQFRNEIEQLPKAIQYRELLSWARERNNPELERICLEYLPLTFSRRHGDPSRPWNQFSIDIKNSDGTEKLNYQGNWRDIFQNWEALGLSYPDFIEGMLSKFLNASTADGYNPYRITREGIDWESPDPNEPWAYIGYWGDHQIIYLQKFLEQSNDFFPEKLEELLTKDIFAFANVPYRIKVFEEMVKDPKHTIEFDHTSNREINGLVEELGTDGRLLRDPNNMIYQVNLTEKILITLLAKLSNFIPGAGIWLNTQRPEWNDANNALVGNGASMVTLYYLRRFLKFWELKFSASSLESIDISEEVKIHFDKTYSLFSGNTALAENGFSDEDRYEFAQSLGSAASDFRSIIYHGSFSGKKRSITPKKLEEFAKLSIKYLDQSIRSNERKDGLYHAYNLISFKGKSIPIRYLYEMLEGQVAVLSSGYLSISQSLAILDTLKSSSLYRPDQSSYLLYPDRQLPRFADKNNISGDQVTKSALLQQLVADEDRSVLSKDINGKFHFNGAFRNAATLEEALEGLDKDKYGHLVVREKEKILGIFEEIFDHQSFTGRSGTFYGYEGLGSIYWHMVSKLLLATQECYFRGIDEKADLVEVNRIKDHYYEIKAGIGLYKSPDLYGAFPTDAYSHTPANAGAKQPGLTGQVKEDIISRFGELGIRIRHGKITFDPELLNSNEILMQSTAFSYYDLSGNRKSVELKAQQLGFTFCQVPFIYTFGQKETIISVYSNGDRKEIPGNELPEEISSKIFSRDGEVERIEYQSQ